MIFLSQSDILMGKSHVSAKNTVYAVCVRVEEWNKPCGNPLLVQVDG